MKDETIGSTAAQNLRITVEQTDFDPPGSDAILRKTGLLAEPRYELPKTRDEKRAIALTTSALSEIRSGLGLGPARIDPRSIHVLTENEMWSRWGDSRQAFASFGHAFIPRSFLFYHFLLHLTHELTHLASFRAVIEHGRGGDDAVVYLRGGLSPCLTASRPRARRFARFNEGVTELVAGEVRRRVAPGFGHPLNPDQEERLPKHFTYPAEVILAKELMRLLDNGGAGEARRILFTDYFSRTNLFLSSLTKLRPGVSGKLAGIKTIEDTLKAAESLGLDEAAVRIRRVMNYRPRR